MKLLFAIKSLNVRGGGAEKVLVDVANGLVGRGHEVEVLTFDFEGEAFYPLSDEIARLDMAFNPAGQSMPRLGMIKALPRMRSAIAAANPHVVIAFMHSTYVPVAAAMLGLPIPLIVSEHTEARHYDTRPIQRRIRQFIDDRASLRTVPSKTVQSRYAWQSGTPCEIVANPVSVESYQAHLGTEPSSPPIVISVGRLMKEKGHAVLLDAFAHLTDEFPDWRLRIVGDGVLRPELEAQVKRLRLEKKVEMPGFTRDVGAVYSASRFVVLPSYYESFGMVAAEALAAGRAVLSFDDCAGIAEIVDSGVNGFLAPGASTREGRVAGLTDALRQMMSDPEGCAAMGTNGPAAVSRFSLESVLDTWERVIKASVHKAD